MGAVLLTGANRRLLGGLEQSLQGVPDEERPALAIAAAVLAAPVTGVDLERASEDASAYLESFPVPGRAVVDLADQASRWLALRTATGESRARLRAGLALLAEAWAAELPLATGALRSLLAEPAPEDPRQDELWVALARAIVDGRLVEPPVVTTEQPP